MHILSQNEYLERLRLVPNGRARTLLKARAFAAVYSNDPTVPVYLEEELYKLLPPLPAKEN